MNDRIAMTSQLRKRSKFRCPSRKEMFTEPMTFRNAMKPKRSRRTVLTARRTLLRSAFSYSLTRAFSSSGRTISSLLLHVPDHEDETELAQGDHEAHDDVQEHEDEVGPAPLADEGHDRHDHDEEQGERDDDGHERLREHPQGLHPLPHLEAGLLLELLRLHEEVRLGMAAARRGPDDALEEGLELRARGGLGGPPARGQAVQH